MIKPLVVVCAIVCLSALGSGCGSPRGLVPVTGKILYRGEPAAGAAVYFHPAGGSVAAGLPIPYGIADDNGTFSLETDGIGAGAMPGRYAVLIEWRTLAGDGTVPVATRGKGKGKLVKRSRVRSGPDRLGGRYFDITKPLIEADVNVGSTRLTPFELTD